MASVARRASKRISLWIPRVMLLFPISMAEACLPLHPGPGPGPQFSCSIMPKRAADCIFPQPSCSICSWASSAPQGGHRQSALQQPELDLARHSVPVGEQVAVLPTTSWGRRKYCFIVILLRPVSPPPHSYAEKARTEAVRPLAYGVIRPVWAPPPQAPLGSSGLLCRGLRDLLLRGLLGDILHHRLSGDALCLLLHTALGLQLRNAGVVGLNGRLSLADPSAGGGGPPAAPAPRSTAGPAPGTPS